MERFFCVPLLSLNSVPYWLKSKTMGDVDVGCEGFETAASCAAARVVAV